MNERFRLLAEQVEWRFADRATGELSEYDKRLIKFAELIVRECAEWVNDNLGLVDEEARKDLLKHFGLVKS